MMPDLAPARRAPIDHVGSRPGPNIACNRRFGCTKAQGFLFYRPAPADDITALLAERTHDTAALPELLGLAPDNT